MAAPRPGPRPAAGDGRAAGRRRDATACGRSPPSAAARRRGRPTWASLAGTSPLPVPRSSRLWRSGPAARRRASVRRARQQAAGPEGDPVEIGQGALGLGQPQRGVVHQLGPQTTVVGRGGLHCGAAASGIPSSAVDARTLHAARSSRRRLARPGDGGAADAGAVVERRTADGGSGPLDPGPTGRHRRRRRQLPAVRCRHPRPRCRGAAAGPAPPRPGGCRSVRRRRLPAAGRPPPPAPGGRAAALGAHDAGAGRGGDRSRGAGGLCRRLRRPRRRADGRLCGLASRRRRGVCRHPGGAVRQRRSLGATAATSPRRARGTHVARRRRLAAGCRRGRRGRRGGLAVGSVAAGRGRGAGRRAGSQRPPPPSGGGAHPRPARGLAGRSADRRRHRRPRRRRRSGVCRVPAGARLRLVTAGDARARRRRADLERPRSGRARRGRGTARAFAAGPAGHPPAHRLAGAGARADRRAGVCSPGCVSGATRDGSSRPRWSCSMRCCRRSPFRSARR